jgi:tRNA 2-selenouridine synthase
MPTQLASLDSLVHPHQIEVQEFDSYGLVIDARSTEAYQEDHIPGAVSVPVASQRLQVSKAERPTLVASDVEPSIPYALAGHLSGLSAGASVLVYCDRGGLDSLVWVDPLKAMGYRVDVLGGGWGNYRRWVDAGLEVLPRALTFRRLAAPPVGGLCPLLHRLATLGEQVLDLADLAGQRLIPGLTLSRDQTPSQAAFDSALLHALRRFDPRRPVWVRDGNGDLGGLALAPSLRDVLQRSDSYWLEVPLAVRAQAWYERLRSSGTDLSSLLQVVSASTMAPEPEDIERWHSLTNAGRMVEALSEFIASCLDSRNIHKDVVGTSRVVSLASLTTEEVAAAADDLRRNSNPEPGSRA